MSSSDPSPAQGVSDRHPILWNGIVFGVLSGALLAADALCKIVWGLDAAWLALGPFVALAWLAAAYRASRWAVGAGVGARTGLVAALLGAAIGATADQILARQFFDRWIVHIIAVCQPAPLYTSGICPYGADPSRQGVLDSELQFTVIGLILLPLLGLLLGLIAGFVGAGRGVRTAGRDDATPGQKPFRRPLSIGLRQLPGPDLVDSGLLPPDTPRP